MFTLFILYTNQESSLIIPDDIPVFDILDNPPIALQTKEIELYDDDTTAVIFTQEQLATALQDIKIKKVHLGDNITLTAGIRIIAVNRPFDELIIDGTNPYEEGFNIYSPNIYTLTESTPKSSLRSNIYIEETGTTVPLSTITLQNISIYGFSYYGPIQVVSEGASNGYTFIYKNIEYSGAQLTWAALSDMYIIDSRIVLRSGNDVELGEVGEAKNFILQGDIEIIKERTNDANSLFNIKQTNGGITILEDAHVVVKDYSPTTSGLYYNCYYFNVGKNAYISYDGYKGISGTATLLNNFTVGESAEVYINIHNNIPSETLGPIYTRTFTLEKDSIFHFTALQNINNYPLIYASNIVIDNPKQTILINNVNSPTLNQTLRFTTSITIETDEIRHFINQIPNYEQLLSGSVTENVGSFHWYNLDASSINIVGTDPLTFAFTNYNEHDTSSPISDYSLRRNNGVIFQQLSAIYYLPGDAESGEVPVDSLSPYRSTTTIEVLENSGYLKKDGYSFDGWKLSDNDIVYQPKDTFTLDRTTTLVAQFKKSGVSVSFDSQVLEIENPESKFVFYDSMYGVLPELQREGYSFQGWYLEPEGIQEITSSTVLELQEDHTLYAKWIAIYTVTVSHLNKDNQVIDTGLYSSIEGEYLSNTIITITALQMDGYEGVHYTIDDTVETHKFDTDLEITSDMHITMFYATTVISIDMPTTVYFSTSASANGEVSSLDYKVQNFSDLPIDIVFEKLEPIVNQMDGIELVNNAVKNTQLHLNILHSSTSNNGFTNSIYNIIPYYQYNVVLGTLNGTFTNDNQTDQIGLFSIGGKYVGSYTAVSKHPNVKFIFRFLLKKE